MMQGAPEGSPKLQRSNWEKRIPKDSEWADPKLSDKLRSYLVPAEVTGWSDSIYPTLDELSQEVRKKSKAWNPDQINHADYSWTVCYDDDCRIHLSEKEGSGWFPRKPRGQRVYRRSMDSPQDIAMTDYPEGTPEMAESPGVQEEPRVDTPIPVSEPDDEPYATWTDVAKNNGCGLDDDGHWRPLEELSETESDRLERRQEDERQAAEEFESEGRIAMNAFKEIVAIDDAYIRIRTNLWKIVICRDSGCNEEAQHTHDIYDSTTTPTREIRTITVKMCLDKECPNAEMSEWHAHQGSDRKETQEAILLEPDEERQAWSEEWITVSCDDYDSGSKNE